MNCGRVEGLQLTLVFANSSAISIASPNDLHEVESIGGRGMGEHLLSEISYMNKEIRLMYW